VHEVGCKREGAVRAGDYNFGRGKISENHKLGTELFAQPRIGSALKIVEFLGIGCHIELSMVAGVMSLL